MEVRHREWGPTDQGPGTSGPLHLDGPGEGLEVPLVPTTELRYDSGRQSRGLSSVVPATYLYRRDPGPSLTSDGL